MAWLKRNVFSCAALLTILSAAAIYADAYLLKGFPYFTDEAEIEAAIEEAFPLFAPYL